MLISDLSSDVCSSDLGVCAEKHPVARPLAKLKALVWQFDLYVSSAVPTRAPDLLRIFGRNGKRRVRTSTHIDYRYRVAATSCLIRSIQRQVGGAYEHVVPIWRPAQRHSARWIKRNVDRKSTRLNSSH